MSENVLGVLIPAYALIFSASFLALWLKDRSAQHVLAFSVGQFCLGSAFLIFHFTGSPDSLLATLAMHFIYSAAFGSLAWGVCRRAKVAFPIRTVAFIVLAAAVLAGLSSVGSDTHSRMFATSNCYGLIMGIAALNLMRSETRETTDNVILGLFAITTLQFFLRPQLDLMTNGPMSAAVYRDSAAYSILILTIAIVSLSLTMALAAAVIKDRVQAIRSGGEIDHLTGLKTRRPFEKSAMRKLDEAAENRVPISMIVADLDHFKQVNDIWGHPAGDAVIGNFGKLIGDTVRDTDLCGRMGGEEFAILAWDCDQASAAQLAERIRTSLSRLSHDELGEDIRLTASFGVASAAPGEGFGKLYAKADRALYQAKDGGRDRVEVGGAVANKVPAELQADRRKFIERRKAANA